MSTAVVERPADTQSSEDLRLSTPDPVLHWLQGMDPSAICGYAHEPEDCPLARFLRVNSSAQGHFISVTVGMALYEIDDQDYRLPPWAKHFVREVDHLSRRHHRAAITADDAFRLLRRLVVLGDDQRAEVF